MSIEASETEVKRPREGGEEGPVDNPSIGADSSETAEPPTKRVKVDSVDGVTDSADVTAAPEAASLPGSHEEEAMASKTEETVATAEEPTEEKSEPGSYVVDYGAPPTEATKTNGNHTGDEVGENDAKSDASDGPAADVHESAEPSGVAEKSASVAGSAVSTNSNSARVSSSPAPSPANATKPSDGLPSGVPSGLPLAVGQTSDSSKKSADAVVDPSAPATVSNPNAVIEEKDTVNPLYVGRVIGKGGEMIRDLQARSGARIDVDQKVVPGKAPIITYRGTRKTIDFAKHLVDLLCQDGGDRAPLPLGEAKARNLVVPASAIGKIIGRGGEMIRELQSRSQAKIQVDHNTKLTDPTMRAVNITGNNLAVTKAEEMVNFLVANKHMDAQTAVNMLVEDKTRGGGVWGSGPPYLNLPNNGVNMDLVLNSGASSSTGPGSGSAFRPSGGPGGGSYGPMAGGRGPHQQTPQAMGGGGYRGSQDQQPPFYGGGDSHGYGGGGHQPHQMHHSSHGGMSDTVLEVFPVAKTYMGRIIGQKGVTINDLQKRTGCDIQVDQDVPPGHDCPVTIKGTREGVELVKHMLREIIELGPNHPYAGGGGAYDRNQAGGYPQHGYNHPQYPSYQQDPSMQQMHSQASHHQGQSFSQPFGYQQPMGVNQQQQQQHMGVNSGGGTGGMSMYQQQAPYMPPPHQQQHSASFQSHIQPMQQQQQSFPPPPPGRPTQTTSDWKSTTSGEGQVYYYNVKTGATQWDKPPGMF